MTRDCSVPVFTAQLFNPHDSDSTPQPTPTARQNNGNAQSSSSGGGGGGNADAAAANTNGSGSMDTKHSVPPASAAAAAADTKQPIVKPESSGSAGVKKPVTDYVFNSGGSVAAMGWAPVGDSKHPCTTCQQYLAIATTPQKYVPLAPPAPNAPGPSVIQIWGFGINQSVTAPRMVLGITHNHGRPWDIKWLPNYIGWQPPSAAAPSRLGVMAVAFVDGSVKLIAVPHPPQSTDNSTAATTSSSPILIDLSSLPVVSLSLPTGEYPISLSIGPHQPSFHPPSLDGLAPKGAAIPPLNPGCNVGAGTLSGVIAVWNISPALFDQSVAESAILSVGDGKSPSDFITPGFCVRSPLAAAIRGLEFNPICHHQLVTITDTGDTELWDMRDPFEPLWAVNLCIESLTSVQWLRSLPTTLLYTVRSGVRMCSFNTSIDTDKERRTTRMLFSSC